jgi:hypothetical protein
MAETSLYELYPLDESRKEIRVLEVLSSLEDGPTHELRVRFHVVSLLDDPDYSALSYVWGEERDTKPLTVDLSNEGSGVHVEQITKNLATALTYVRGHFAK